VVVDSAVTGGPHEEKLIDDILHNRNYTALARPVAEESEALVVSFGLSLQQIIKIVSAAGSAEARSPPPGGVVLKRSGGRLKRDLDKDFKQFLHTYAVLKLSYTAFQ